jgi:hypothetical protein
VLQTQYPVAPTAPDSFCPHFVQVSEVPTPRAPQALQIQSPSAPPNAAAVTEQFGHDLTLLSNTRPHCGQ